MEEERASGGCNPTDDAGVAAPDVPAASQHPTVAERVAAATEAGQRQQNCGSSATHNVDDSATAVNGSDHASCLAMVPEVEARSALICAEPQATEGNGVDDTDASRSFAAPAARAAFEGGGMEVEAESTPGNAASSALEQAAAGTVGEGAATKAATTGAFDGNTPCAVAEETGDAGGAESDGKESNDSVCNECGGGGEVVCCDGCVKSYHTDCLPVAARPRLRANAEDWFCPDCTASSAPPPPPVVLPSPGAPKAPQGLPDSRGSRQNTAPASPAPVYLGPAPVTPWTALPSCVPTRRRKTKATEDYETRINVGPNHQVPQLPDFFLARGDGDSLSSIAEQSLADGAQSQALGPLLVYSPYLMERSKQQCLADRAAKSCINSQKDLAEFLIKCSKRWKVRPGWQPFSPEFAYKLLHRANYDPERALRMMDDSAFCFQSICDPPLRKYENKWKRRDKRGTFPSSPYPPPVVVRGYLNEKQRQMRMGR